jgi:hypothetical protein
MDGVKNILSHTVGDNLSTDNLYFILGTVPSTDPAMNIEEC